jgi:hypothetical protein
MRARVAINRIGIVVVDMRWRKELMIDDSMFFTERRQ